MAGSPAARSRTLEGPRVRCRALSRVPPGERLRGLQSPRYHRTTTGPPITMPLERVLLPDRDRLESDLAAFYDQQAPRRLARGGAGSGRQAAREVFLARLHAEGRSTAFE